LKCLKDLVEEKLSKDIDLIDSILNKKDRVREEAIRLSREILRASAEAVRLIHLGLYDKALSKVNEARDRVRLLKSLLNDHPDLFYSGLVYNCLSEFVEAVVVYSLIVDKTMPEFRELDVPYVPFLQGLGDSIGELRRHVIELLRSEKYDEAGIYLDVMETIYQFLRKLNYPDALIPGIRHKVDVARRLIEDTKTLYLEITINTKLYKKTTMLLNKLKTQTKENQINHPEKINNEPRP